MSIEVLCALAALLAYGAATAQSVADLRQRTLEVAARQASVAFWFAAAALMCHLTVAYLGVVTQQGFNFSLSESLSVIAAMAVAAFLLASVRFDVTVLGLALFPVAAVTALLGVLVPGSALVPESAPVGLQLHVLLSLAAYGLLTLGAAQAIVLAIADARLKQRRSLSGISLLPPLRSMESVLFHFIALGFFLLTLGLACGALFVDDLFDQHLLHKTVLSVFAWLLFGVLLIGRVLWGWRGRLALRYVLTGFVSLLLAFVGSKFVLEVLLQQP